MRISGIMKHASRAITLCTVLLVGLTLSSCEKVFTTSPFSGMTRDPSDMSVDQQIAYGENALASGDQKSMQDAYDALAKSLEDGKGDGDAHSLAADLAMGASGVNDVLPDLTEAATSGSLDNTDEMADTLNDSLDKIDADYVDEAQKQVDAAEQNGGEVTEDQYLTVAAGMVLAAGKEKEGIENVGKDDADEVKQFVDKAVENTGATDGPLKDMQDALNQL